jgi:hypothetical protein
MPNPFPGVDPYVEACGEWPDFHHRFITYCRDVLGDCLPRAYRARAQEHVRLVHVAADEAKVVVPDVLISQLSGREALEIDAASSVSTLEPVTIPFASTMELRESWIEIIRQPDQELVAVIEVLSPDNKQEKGCDRYDARRVDLQAERIHLVEIDLLMLGRRLPMRRPLPRAHYYALVADAARRPNCEVYHWTVRQALPKSPIPLAAPEPPVMLDLAAVYSLTYERAHYDRELDYSTPLPAGFHAADSDWIGERVGER